MKAGSQLRLHAGPPASSAPSPSRTSGQPTIPLHSTTGAIRFIVIMHDHQRGPPHRRLRPRPSRVGFVCDVVVEPHARPLALSASSSSRMTAGIIVTHGRRRRSPRRRLRPRLLGCSAPTSAAEAQARRGVGAQRSSLRRRSPAMVSVAECAGTATYETASSRNRWPFRIEGINAS